MNKKRFSKLFATICLLVTSSVYAQTTEVTFPLFDGAFEYFTMKQSDDMFLSAYQFASDAFFSNCNLDVDFGYATPKERLNHLPEILYAELPYFSLMMLDSFLFVPITHEEAHRSILTAKNIGSVSQPIFKFSSWNTGIAYVKGVSDETLKDLRDTDFPTFIRMHTAGNESDYCIIQKDFEGMAFCENEYDLSANFPVGLFFDYLMRDLSLVSYFQMSTTRGIDITEEANELDRDIVGDDICGMIHHLFNPTAEYHRYFRADDFSEEEMKFGKRIFWRSFLDYPMLITPSWFGTTNISLGDKAAWSFNTGYCIAPFGDFIDENLYLHLKNVMCGPMNFVFTARQYENKENWFPAFTLKCERFSPLSWLSLNFSGDIWWQPENLSFTTDKAFVGGAVSLGCNIFPFKTLENAKYDFGINMNVMYKTKGFKPEIVSMDEDLIFTAGLSLRY